MTKAQAEKLARQIFDEFGQQIREAVRGTVVPAEFIAGLVANEAGKDRQGNIRRAATRFEPHIYTRLKRVASTPRATFNSIKHSHLQDATDESLRALAHSYEATQMMGYWVIILGCTLADLKNPAKHFFYTVKLLQLNGFPRNATESQMDGEMRQWNTGRETGKTYHANYVPNAKLIRAAYRELEANYKSRTVNERVSTATASPQPSPTPNGLDSVENQIPQPGASSGAGPSNDTQFEPTQVIEKTTEGDKTTTVVAEPPQNVVIEKEKELTFEKPKGFFRTLWAKVTGAFGGAITTDVAVEKASQAQALGLSERTWTVIFWVVIGALVLWILYEVWVQKLWPFLRWLISWIRTHRLMNANSTPTNQVKVESGLTDERIKELEEAGWLVIRRA